MINGSNPNGPLSQDVSQKIEASSFEVNSKEPCPLCSKDHFCYVFSDGQRITKAVCQWTDEAPPGWDRTGTAKDGRGIFSLRGAPQNRKFFPGFISLSTRACGGEKHWDDPYWREGNPQWEETGNEATSGAKELVIYYEYPAVDGTPLGRVERRQWSDRRQAYEQNRKTKQIRPQHWVGPADEGRWNPKGKGFRPWPLYREREAVEEIRKGGIVFVVGGEQAVETYRALGLCATTCQGGESNYRQIIERLTEYFEDARAEQKKPMLVVHPDHDLTGEANFGEGLIRECYPKKIPAVCMEPLDLWPQCPPGGDITDFIAQTELPTTTIIKTLETAISEAVDRQELEIRGRMQRSRWQAPEAWYGELGVWKSNSEDDEPKFRPLCDFDFQIERELISEDGGGLMLQVKRTDDRAQSRVYIKSQDYSSTAKFIDAIKKGLGGGIICNLSNYQLQSLIRVRLHEYRATRQGKAYRLIDRVGNQKDGAWVFKACQFDRHGQPTDENRSLWVWNPEITNSDRDIKPTIIAPQSPDTLKHYLAIVQQATGSNFLPTLLTMGYGAAGVHYQTIIEEEGAFPVGNIYGDPGGGKTSAALFALALVGQHKVGVMREISISAAYERLKLAGGLTHCLDDPKRDEHLDEFLKGFYNGKSRVVRGKESGFNTQEPHSPLIVTSNHAVGESSAATQSRLFRLFFPKVGDGDPEAWRELPKAMDEASGALTQIIAMGYPKDEVYACETELRPFLPEAHARIAKSLALVLVYAKKLAELAGIETATLVAYVQDVLCAQSNDPDESGDSLRDFTEKLFLLESEAKVGPWNMKWVEKRDGSKSLAIYLPGVWKAMDKSFNLAYNRKIIESLLRAKGIKTSKQKFHLNEDVSRAWERAKLTSNNGYLNPVETSARDCFELSNRLLGSFSENFDDENLALLSSTREIGGWDDPQSLSELETSSQSQVEFLNSTQLYSALLDEKTGINEHMPVERVEQSRVEKNDSKKPLKPLGGVACSPRVERVERVEQQDPNLHKKPDMPLCHPPTVTASIGSIVVPFATAVWVRSKESTKIPYRELKPSLRDAKEIPLEAMPPDLWTELLGPARVVAISKDGHRLRTINQATGRTAVFYRDQVGVLPEVPHADE